MLLEFEVMNRELKTKFRSGEIDFEKLLHKHEKVFEEERKKELEILKSM